MPFTNHDPLAAHLARGHITQAQYLAAQEFRKLYAAKAERLAKPDSELGADGSSIVCDVLIAGMTTRQIATSRGKIGPDWERYYARRLRECLATLAAIYGFSKGEKKIRASGAKTQIIGAQ